eukprot:6071372-Prymnesium_polylepis.1
MCIRDSRPTARTSGHRIKLWLSLNTYGRDTSRISSRGHVLDPGHPCFGEGGWISGDDLIP